VEGKEEKGLQTRMDPETMEVDKSMEDKGIQVKMDLEIKEVEKIVIKEVKRKVHKMEKEVQTEEEEIKTGEPIGPLYTGKDVGDKELGRRMDEIMSRVKILEDRSGPT